MKRVLLALSLFGCLFAVSCEKEQIEEPLPSTPETPEQVVSAPVFSATIDEPQTKTTLEGLNVYWKEGDKISINGKEFTATLPEPSNKKNAKFTETDSSVPFSGTTYSAYYPSFIYDSANKKAAMPSSWTYQQYVDEYNMPMYAYSETTNLQFKVICGVFAIKVTSSCGLTSVKSITISSSDSALSGEISIVNGNQAKLVETATQSDAVILSYAEAATIDETGKVFYLPLPVQSYKNIEIEVSDGTESKFMVTKENVSINIERKKLYSMSFVANFTPATFELSVDGIGNDNDARH